MAKKKASTRKTVAQKKTARKKATPKAARRSKTNQSPLPVTRVSENLTIKGYLVDRQALTRIDAASRRALAPDDPGSCALQISAHPSDNASRLQFDSIPAALEHLDINRIEITALATEYTGREESQLEIVMTDGGTITLSGLSTRSDFYFHIDQLKRELSACDQEFPVVARFLSFSRFPRRIIAHILTLASLYLFFNIAYYLYALTVGVNVDPEILPDGNKYFQEVEAALKSGTESEKIDTILRGQFLHFSNVSSVLDRCRTHLIASLIAILVGVSAVFGIRGLRRLYPFSFFAFGPNADRLKQLTRRREILSVAIVIAFAVNIIAGIIVAVVSR